MRRFRFSEPAQRSGVGNHARYLQVVTIRNQQGPTQLALRLWRLRRKDMTRLRLAPLDLAGTSLAEALLRARMGLQLGHFLLFVRQSVRFQINSNWRITRQTGVSLPS